MSTLRRLTGVLGLGYLAMLGACSETEVAAELRSLQGSEDAVFVCRDADGGGHPFSECPDRDPSNDEELKGLLSIYALVSQTITDEVAIVNVSTGRVIDADPSTPGFGFLRVGGRPVAMAASPGGAVSFVATADAGRNGIFALPTQCLGRPAPDKTAGRDLATWPACRLPSAPGELTVLVEPPSADGGITTSCDGLEAATTTPAGADATTRACPANLQTEGGPEGRRKLLVSLPDLGELAVIDAQGVLDTVPGDYPPCVIERHLKLDAQVPADIAQTLPADLETTCAEVPAPTAPQPSRLAPQPAGFGLADDRLYVADQTAPVIHVVDTSSVCNLRELPPLLPMSLREPERVVTTRRVAVSPLTPSGQQFVYAIDAEDQPGASVMAFDVSPGSTDRTPIVRPGSPELPGEKPDRLALGSSARDVTFAYRDLPYVDPGTGVGTFGSLCDPNPSLDQDSPGALARPSSDFLSGARPGLLRGLFGFVLLTNGQVAIVDVDDFDKPCRRPAQSNASSTPDFRGCVGDADGTSFVSDETPTVTNEVSCRVVEPHRFRGSSLAINDPDVGVRAPALRGYPQLTLPASAASSQVEDRPRLLGVPFPGAEVGKPIDIDVFVGATPHNTDQDSEDPLPIDPNSQVSEQVQSQNSVVLPPLQPRAYAAEDTVTLTYEGSLAGDRTSGFLREGGTRLDDAALSFCAAGVYDEVAMADLALNQLGLGQADAAAFGREHSDYVQLTTPLLTRADSWWKDHDFEECLTEFGLHDAEKLLPSRDFRVVRAFADHLLLEPRTPGVDAKLAEDCFPTANKYRVRAGGHWALVHAATGFNHDIVATGADRACVRSCNPLKKWAKSRAFEISSVAADSSGGDEPHCRGPLDEGDPLSLRVGCAKDGEVACVFDQGAPGDNFYVTPGSAGSECLFEGLTDRFAIYRGRLASERDMVFTWQTTGGFSPLLMSLANVSTTVSPQSIQFLQQPELMAVVDGAGLGLSLLSLDTFLVTKPSPFY